MRVRTFTAATMPDAMAQVRAEMGEDAVILSSQRGKHGIEVRAAAERKAQLEDLDGAYGRFAALESEMERRLLAALAEPRSAPRAAPPAWTLDLVEKRLAFHETPRKLAATLTATARKFEDVDGLNALAQALDAHLEFAPLPPDLESPIALIGPPGAGKTASAAKLAVRAVLSGRPAAIISADTSAGAASQIEAFAQIIRMPVLSAETPEALTDAIAELRATHGELALIIDTPGVNPFDRTDSQLLKNLLAASGAEPVLVTQAHGGGDLEDQALLFRALGARRLIATRLDLTRRLGGLLAAVAASGLALAQGAASPYIAETLEPMNPFALARRLLTGAADPTGAAP